MPDLKNIQYKINNEMKVHGYKDLQLWPFSCADRSKGIILAWYQYSSNVSPAPSDIYVSTLGNDGRWSLPSMISENVSYNNGPSVAQLEHERIAVYWHSWREPGVKPFEGGGGTTYIWGAISDAGRIDSWGKPFLVFPGVGRQLYPSVAKGPSGDYYMVYSNGYGQVLSTAISSDGINWEKGEDINGYKSPNRPDIAVDKDGVWWVIFSAMEGDKRRIFFVKSKDGINWTEQGLDLDFKCDLDRPKVNIDKSGNFWITLQTDYWKVKTCCREVISNEDKMVFKIGSDGSAGNHCWAINALCIENLETGIEKKFRFCNDDTEDVKGYVSVGHKKIYDVGTGFGFRSEVSAMKRLIGDEITSNFVYGNKSAEFIVRIPPGKYMIKAVMSPWLSSKLGTFVNVNRTLLSCSSDEASSIIIGRFESQEGVNVFWHVDNGSDIERTRPSRIVEYGENRYIMFWNYFFGSEQGISSGEVMEVL